MTIKDFKEKYANLYLFILLSKDTKIINDLKIKLKES